MAHDAMTPLQAASAFRAQADAAAARLTELEARRVEALETGHGAPTPKELADAIAAASQANGVADAAEVAAGVKRITSPIIDEIVSFVFANLGQVRGEAILADIRTRWPEVTEAEATMAVKVVAEKVTEMSRTKRRSANMN